MGSNDVNTTNAEVRGYIQNEELWNFKVDYANLGSKTANGAILEFQIPEKLRAEKLKFIKAPNIEQNTIQFSPDKITFPLPTLRPSE